MRAPSKSNPQPNAAPLVRRYVDTRQLAESGPFSESWLEKARVAGNGPPFLKVGRAVRYDVGKVDEWLAQQQRRSTSDRGAP